VRSAQVPLIWSLRAAPMPGAASSNARATPAIAAGHDACQCRIRSLHAPLAPILNLDALDWKRASAGSGRVAAACWQTLMPCRHPTRRRSKPRPRKGKVRTPVIGLALIVTRAEIQELEALAAADLRRVHSTVGWFVALELSRAAPKGAVFSARGARARDRRVALKVDRSLPREAPDELVARAEAEMRSVSGLVSRLVVEALVRK